MEPAETNATPAGRPPKMRGTHRVCRKCLRNTPLTPNEWPHAKGQPIGAVCKSCSRVAKRHQKFDRKVVRAAVRKQSGSELQTAGPSPSQGAGLPAVSTGNPLATLPIGKLSTARALQAGASVVNEYAEDILELVAHYALTKTSIHHEWALGKFFDLVAPAKLYANLGAKAAGLDDKDKGKRTTPVTIYVGGRELQAPPGGARVSVVPAVPPGRIIDVEPAAPPASSQEAGAGLDDLL